jgi:hypothetical protein
MVELFNIRNDPEELENLYTSEKNIAGEMLAVVLERIETANEAYQ